MVPTIFPSKDRRVREAIQVGAPGKYMIDLHVTFITLPIKMSVATVDISLGTIRKQSDRWSLSQTHPSADILWVPSLEAQTVVCIVN